MSVLTIIPRISEKTYASAQDNTYVFNVPITANKHQVALAVTAEYSVGVVDVRLVNVKGKKVRAFRGKKAQPGIAQRKTVKKAYVRIAAGDSINIFNEETAGEK